MNDKEKLRVIRQNLVETYEDSREYMDDFYDDCQNGEVEELGWLDDDDQMDNFINACPVEYNRIYDYALLELSRRLLKTINDE